MKAVVNTNLLRYDEKRINRYRKGDLRNNFIFGFIGHNRTGKTSIAIEMAKSWKESRPDSAVIAFDPQNKIKKSTVEINQVQVPLMDYEIYLHEQGHWYNKILEHRNFLLILDDYRNLHPKTQAEKGWLYLMSHREDYNIDIIYITHSPSLILNILTNFTTHYFIFYTLAQLGSFEKKIPHYSLCMGAVNYVNRHVKAHGKGTYPKFPYIMVNTLDEELTAINMEV